MVSNEARLKEIVSYYIKHDTQETADKFNISYETVSRYCRQYKVLFGDLPIEEEDEQKPNILIFDIETMPLLSYTWGIWDQNIGLNQLESDWFCATVSCKWYGEDEMFSERLNHKEMVAQDDKRLMNWIWKFLEEADMVITHNGDRFDIPRLQTRFLLHGINPPMPYQSIDTLKIAKRNFKITSNKLDYIGKFLGVGQKVDTGGFELWRRCMQGDDSALEEMSIYNEGDVLLLERVYDKLKPYIKSHPNYALFTDSNKTVCPTCGSGDIRVKGTYTTSVGKYSAYRCNDCGAISRARVSTMTKEKRKSLLAPIAR